MFTVPLSTILFSFMLFSVKSKRYEPSWESLDSRPLPTWYDESKFGIFIHWGVFSVPSFGNERFWYKWKGLKVPKFVDFMKNNYKPNFAYPEFSSEFTAEFFDPVEWVKLFNESGARYIVFTSKHHEGFTNWPSSASFNWNSQAVGPKRNIVGELAAAVREQSSLYFGLYHSLFEWFNPLYLLDKHQNFTTRYFPERKTLPELYELVERYKPDIVWSDGDRGPYEYWNSTGFLAWLYNDSPIKDVVVTNDRWGEGCLCKHGGYWTCQDGYNPGKLEKHKWENCMTIDKKSWGYRREATLSGYRSIQELINSLITTVSCGGNFLLDVGPTKDGRITPIYEERLKQLGEWLSVNGEAIYSSKPWIYQNDTLANNLWYTMKENTVYAMFQSWPNDYMLILGCPSPTPDTKISMLGYNGLLNWRAHSKGQGITIDLPRTAPPLLPSLYAWTIKFQNLTDV